MSIFSRCVITLCTQQLRYCFTPQSAAVLLLYVHTQQLYYCFMSTLSSCVMDVHTHQLCYCFISTLSSCVITLCPHLPAVLLLYDETRQLCYQIISSLISCVIDLCAHSAVTLLPNVRYCFVIHSGGRLSKISDTIADVLDVCA